MVPRCAVLALLLLQAAMMSTSIDWCNLRCETGKLHTMCGFETYYDDLEAIARKWSEQCIPAHDACRSTPRFEEDDGFNSGQNFGTQKSDMGMPSNEMTWFNFLEWINERKNVPSAKSAPSGNENGQKKFSHWTQLVWADSYTLGCAEVVYKVSGQFERTTFCNYGPGGNLRGRRAFKMGPACTKCPRGTSCRFDSDYTSLCALPSDPKKRQNLIALHRPISYSKPDQFAVVSSSSEEEPERGSGKGSRHANRKKAVNKDKEKLSEPGQHEPTLMKHNEPGLHEPVPVRHMEPGEHEGSSRTHVEPGKHEYYERFDSDEDVFGEHKEPGIHESLPKKHSEPGTHEPIPEKHAEPGEHEPESPRKQSEPGELEPELEGHEEPGEDEPEPERHNEPGEYEVEQTGILEGGRNFAPAAAAVAAPAASGAGKNSTGKGMDSKNGTKGKSMAAQSGLDVFSQVIAGLIFVWFGGTVHLIERTRILL